MGARRPEQRLEKKRSNSVKDKYEIRLGNVQIAPSKISFMVCKQRGLVVNGEKLKSS